MGRATPAAGRALVETYRNFIRHKSPSFAAGIAFYSLLSFAPLVLTVGAICTNVAGRSDLAVERTQAYLSRFLPLSDAVLREMIGNLVSTSVPVGGVYFVVVLWASTGAFNLIYESICYAGEIPARFVRRRLMSVGVVLGLAVVMLLGFFLSSSLPFLRDFSLSELGLGPRRGAMVILVPLAHGLAMAAALTLIYKAIAGRQLRWRSAFIGAVVFGPIWELTKWVFWRLASGSIESGGAIYGSLNVLIVVLFWVYYSACILILGAELAFVVQRRIEPPTDEAPVGSPAA